MRRDVFFYTIERIINETPSTEKKLEQWERLATRVFRELEQARKEIETIKKYPKHTHISQLASRSDIKFYTVHDAIVRGELKSVRITERNHLVENDEFDRWLKTLPTGDSNYKSIRMEIAALKKECLKLNKRKQRDQDILNKIREASSNSAILREAFGVKD